MTVPPVVWRRLSVRLAALFTLCLAAVVAATMLLREPWMRWFGLPGRVELEDRFEAEAWVHLFYGDRWHPEQERPVFSKAARTRLDTAVRTADRALLWLDREGKVVFASTGLPWSKGAVPAAAALALPTLPDGRPARRQVIEVTWQQRAAGTVCLWIPRDVVRPRRDAQDAAELPSALVRAMLPAGLEPEVRVEAPLDFDRSFFVRMQQAQERFAIGVVVVVPLIFGALLAVVVAFTVTRRLHRIARQVAAPEALAVGVSVRGRDEIAFLGAEIERLRGRVAGLVADLEQRDRTRREWVAQVSHDLRTPLTALSLCLQRLGADAGGMAWPERQRLLHSAGDDLVRLRELVDDLFEIARLEAGARLRPEDIMPEELVGQSIRALRPLADAAHVELSMSVAGVAPTLHGDGHLLKRALENLLRNAIRHARSRVDVAIETVATGVRLCVRDDGPGLPTEGVIAASPAAPELRAAPDSAGLGLRVTAQVAAVHGGELRSRRLPTGGCELALSMPLGR